MNNSTVSIPSVTYHSAIYWLTKFGSDRAQDIKLLTLLPIGIIGFILNILVLVVLRNKEFELSVYSYIRAYTFNSALICLLISTRFVTKSYTLFKFTNTLVAQLYSSKFYVPVTKFLYLYGSFLDILLTFDRIVLFSNRFQFFKRLKPLLVCIIIAPITLILVIYHFINREIRETSVKLNKTEIFVIYSVKGSKLNDRLANIIINSIIDLLPIVLEILFNVATIFFLKKYINKKKHIIGDVQMSSQPSAKFTENANKTKQQNRTRKMEIRVTVLILVMSIISIM
jgi:hypothetical protein